MPISPPHNILVSYHYYRKYDLDRLAGLRIVGDSGAYSARTQGADISNTELAAWAKTWRHRLCWVASVDVARNVPKTRDNWKALVDVGIPAVSSIHVGEHPSEMDWYAEQGVDFLGLGGMAGGFTPIPVQMRWLVSVFRYARDNHPAMRFHGWGVTANTFTQLPFFSVDSSGWGGGYRYGRLTLRDPNSSKDYALDLNGRETFRPEVARLLRDQYGVNPSEVATSGPHNRLLMVRLSALSASVQEQRIRQLHRRHLVTAPVWGQLEGRHLAAGMAGPHLHLAAIGRPARDEESAMGSLAETVREQLEGRHLAAGMAGPHLHLAEGHGEHLEVVARLNGSTHAPGSYR